MKKAFTIFVGFLHDFATGCWAATVLAVYWIHRLSFDSPETGIALFGLKQEFFWLGLGCAAVVLITGMGRTLTYASVGSIYGEDAEPLRRTMLVIKHVVLLTVFGSGIWWQYAMVYR